MRGTRLIIRGFLVVLVLAGVVPFILPLKDGRPLLRWSDLRLPPLPKLSLLGGGAADKSTPVTLYRWRDAEGVTQLSSERPRAGVAYEAVVIDPDTNVIQAQKPVEPAPAAPAVAGETGAAGDSAGAPSNPYTPSGLEKLLGDTKRVKDLANAREAELRKQNGAH